MIHRIQQTQLEKRLKESRKFIQVLLGPRQVGKTTIAKTLFDKHKGPKLFLSADDPSLSQSLSLNDQWRNLSLSIQKDKKECLLIIDEIHKYPDWDQIVKARWDEDSLKKLPIKVIILGSAPLLIQTGLAESLAGRFETIHVPHWSLSEVKKAFNLSLDQFIFYGGYPGAMDLIDEEQRWLSYVNNSLIETTLSRDIMLLTRIDKPALMRRLFHLACQYSGQILSYQKMTGQLQDAGNTTTLAHYLHLLEAVGFVAGLAKFTGSKVLSRASSPKLQVFNTALLSAQSNENFKSVKSNPTAWGRWVESAVGAHLINQKIGTDLHVEYWSEGNFEVDFIVRNQKKVIAIEVKSGKKKERLPGLEHLKKKHSIGNAYQIGEHGIPVEEFLLSKISDFF